MWYIIALSYTHTHLDAVQQVVGSDAARTNYSSEEDAMVVMRSRWDGSWKIAPSKQENDDACCGVAVTLKDRST